MLETGLVRKFIVVATLALAAASCGDVVREGRSPVYLVLDSLTAAPSGGFGAGKFGGSLFSDVIVNVTTPDPCTTTNPCPTVFADTGQMVVHLVSKDVSISPTTNNEVTITRYHVIYRRADGRNTPGQDVPWAFDGAVSGLVPPSGPATFNFEIVRHVAKKESPLVQLISNPTIINTIADVTLYGTDQVGNAITVTGSISIEFGNFGD